MSHEVHLEELSAKIADSIPNSSIRVRNLKDIVLACVYNDEIGMDLLNVIKEGVQIVLDHEEMLEAKGAMNIRKMSYLMKIELLYQHLEVLKNMPSEELGDKQSEELVSQLLERLN